MSVRLILPDHRGNHQYWEIFRRSRLQEMSISMAPRLLSISSPEARSTSWNLEFLRSVDNAGQEHRTSKALFENSRPWQNRESPIRFSHRQVTGTVFNRCRQEKIYELQDYESKESSSNAKSACNLWKKQEFELWKIIMAMITEDFTLDFGDP